MAQISVAMMTHNETAEFRWLMGALVPALDVIDEIVIVDDFGRGCCADCPKSCG
jgi:hypothetical protein